MAVWAVSLGQEAIEEHDQYDRGHDYVEKVPLQGEGDDRENHADDGGGDHGDQRGANSFEQFPYPIACLFHLLARRRTAYSCRDDVSQRTFLIAEENHGWTKQS